MSTITREQAQKIIEAADEIITALAGTNEDVHPESDNMLHLWDDLNDRYAPPEVVRELARIALASLEAEPVAYIRSAHKPDGFCFADGIHPTHRHQRLPLSTLQDGYYWEVTPLYTAPPAPVSVPDERAVELLATDLMKRIDKITGERHSVATLSSLRVSIVEACRAVMLQGSEQTNYRAIVERIAEIVHGKVTDIDLLTVTVKSIKDNLQGKASLRDEIRSEHAEWSQYTFGDAGPVGPLKHLSKEALEAAAEPEDLSEWADMQFLLWDAQRRAGITDEKITQALIDKLAVNKARQWPEPKDGEPRLHIKSGLKLEGQEKQKK